MRVVGYGRGHGPAGDAEPFDKPKAFYAGIVMSFEHDSLKRILGRIGFQKSVLRFQSDVAFVGADLRGDDLDRPHLGPPGLGRYPESLRCNSILDMHGMSGPFGIGIGSKIFPHGSIFRRQLTVDPYLGDL